MTRFRFPTRWDAVQLATLVEAEEASKPIDTSASVFQLTCWSCNKPGHMEFECRSRGRGMASRGREQGQSRGQQGGFNGDNSRSVFQVGRQVGIIVGSRGVLTGGKAALTGSDRVVVMIGMLTIGTPAPQGACRSIGGRDSICRTLAIGLLRLQVWCVTGATAGALCQGMYGR